MPVRPKSPATLVVPLDVDDDTVEGFYAELNSRLAGRPAEIALDCSLLERAASAHVNTLWQARNKCEEAGVEIRLTSVSYGLARVLMVLDLYDFFKAERDGVEAQAGYARSAAGRKASPDLDLEIETTAEGVISAMARLHEHLAERSFGEMFMFDIETVFYEVATNIRLHGGMGNGDRIRFRASQGDGVMRLRFEDAGPRFDPTSALLPLDPGAAARNRRRRGFGLVMIRKLVDRISYERSERGVNVLELEKSIGGNGGRLE